ncbi:MAG: RNA 2',3'-cyclic phosphodiesterase [Roseovarius sp.]
MRAFLAIPVPEERLPRLHDVQHALEVGRAVDPENWHVTLAFLGDQPVEALEALHELLAAIVAEPFEMRLRGVDIFGGARPSILFAGVEPSEPLIRLRKKVRAAVRASGIELPRERFRPHVTLARFGRRHTMLETQRIAGVLEAWGDLDAGREQVEGFALYRSQLGEGGPLYEALAEYPLGAATG